MCDAWDTPATHTREDVIHAAMIRAGMCAARGLSESQACHPPGCEPSPLAAGDPASVSPAPRVAREPGGFLDARKWKLTPRQRETLDRICDLGCQKLAARAMGVSVRTIQVNMNNMRHNNGLQLIQPLSVFLAWDRAKRAAA